MKIVIGLVSLVSTFKSSSLGLLSLILASSPLLMVYISNETCLALALALFLFLGDNPGLC
jgi:hypothetical protein